ncbi:MAG: 3D-(3,5/4)-trihydroxycyclohexane-1,2-dione hydrolase [Steroidobacteraceae bacterium]|nr:3D-(3,5/4)-trihydroxycyclohexane-1,2-dione hydrolase [Steroidobacteraceae bacterium]
MKRLRLTTAQAIVRYLVAQRVRIDSTELPLFAGVFAIFGHGNVAGLGEALQAERNRLPTWRAHNEQAMAHAAIAFAKASRRRRLIACTTSIGPGATNMVTAAALAHVNRLPVLLLPGDTFANRDPDPVLQQVEHFGDPTITANDCFRPVSRYWDRIVRPEQLLASLPQALSVLTDPADCGPVTLALPQDVQAEAGEFPAAFFEPHLHEPVRLGPDAQQLRAAAALITGAQKPLIVAGGGVLYSEANEALAAFATARAIPVCETQAGKGALPWDHPCNVGAVGVTGTGAANALAAEADLIIAIGTRLADFTTGSGRLLPRAGCRLLSLNVCRHDLVKRGATALQADARRGLEELASALSPARSKGAWLAAAQARIQEWNAARDAAVAARNGHTPSDAEVLDVANRVVGTRGTVVCAAGGLPGELHKLWRADGPDAYHVEYGYSCMGYEIAGGLGVKMAQPARDIVVLVGDGSYLMMNSEIATSIALGLKLTIVLLDNRGFGCINRLQQACGGDAFNNLLDDASPRVDFVAHARALGAIAEKADNLAALEPALRRALAADRTAVVVIETDPAHSTAAGGAWWNVPVAEISASERVQRAFADYRGHVDDSPDAT